MRGADRPRTERARTLRRDQTGMERRLWQRLRARQLAGAKFVRQEPVGPYFADFACREARLIVELDGGQHGGPRDALRDARIEALGYRVLRFWNTDVAGNMDGVLEAIMVARDGRGSHPAPHPGPLPACGEREQATPVPSPSPRKRGEGRGEGESV